MTFQESCTKLTTEKICNSDCCGPVDIPTLTIQKHITKIQELPTETLPDGQGCKVMFCEDNKCAFLNRETNKCVIYDDRPQICRDFGISPGTEVLLECPYLKPNGNHRSPAQMKRMQRLAHHKLKFTIDKVDKMLKQKSSKEVS